MFLAVKNDSKTVWINGPSKLFARFCPISQEYLKDATSLDQDTLLHPPKPTKQNWINFCNEVQKRFNFPIPKKFTPKYLAD